MGTSSSARPTTRRGRALVALSAATIFVAVAPRPATAAENLFVDLRTDYRPGEDFTSIHVIACEHPGPGRCTEASRRPVFTSERDAFLVGVRVAEMSLPPGRGLYMVTASLSNADGASMARRQILLDFRGGRFVMTFVFARPLISADKKAELAVDRDGDGALSSGDVLRYEVVVRNAGGFTDVPGPGGRLVPGSVTTSHGTVSEGNDPGDTAVEVRGLEDAGSGGAVITFDVEVEAVVTNQGVAFIDRNPRDSSWSLAIEPTDDPDTEAPRDPTIRVVACSLGSCEKERAACERDLETCREDRQQLKDQLTALLADTDGDGVPAVLELCAATAAGAAVDDRGCSLVQFCGRVDLGAPAGELACKRADWLGDEPALSEPHDCRPSGGSCVPE